MGRKFVIGNRLKEEWISVLDTDKKEIGFTSYLVNALEYLQEEDAQINLAEIQETGYFGDLQIYLKQDDKALLISEQNS